MSVTHIHFCEGTAHQRPFCEGSNGGLVSFFVRITEKKYLVIKRFTHTWKQETLQWHHPSVMAGWETKFFGHLYSLYKILLAQAVFHSPSQIFAHIGERVSASFPACMVPHITGNSAVVQELVQVQITDPLWRESTDDQMTLISRNSNAETVPMSWCHHEWIVDRNLMYTIDYLGIVLHMLHLFKFITFWI